MENAVPELDEMDRELTNNQPFNGHASEKRNISKTKETSEPAAIAKGSRKSKRANDAEADVSAPRVQSKATPSTVKTSATKRTIAPKRTLAASRAVRGDEQVSNAAPELGEMDSNLTNDQHSNGHAGERGEMAESQNVEAQRKRPRVESESGDQFTFGEQLVGKPGPREKLSSNVTVNEPVSCFEPEARQPAAPARPRPPKPIKFFKALHAEMAARAAAAARAEAAAELAAHSSSSSALNKETPQPSLTIKDEPEEEEEIAILSPPCSLSSQSKPAPTVSSLPVSTPFTVLLFLAILIVPFSPVP